MKKTLMALALSGILLTAYNCKKNETSETKIDFTKSYEDAALALSNAQKNYDAAVATNDPVKIETAKKELESAKQKYVESKQVYVSQGGTVKPEYETYLVTSNQVLETNKTPDVVVNNMIKKSDSILTGKTNAEIENTAKEIKASVNAEKAKLVENATKKVSDAKVAADKAKSDFKKSTDETKKSANEKIDKAQKELNNLFK